VDQARILVDSPAAVGVDTSEHIYLQAPVLITEHLLKVEILVAQNLEEVVLAECLVLMEHQMLWPPLDSVPHLMVNSIATLLALEDVPTASEDYRLVHLIPTDPLDQEEVQVQASLNACQVSTESLIRKEECLVRGFKMAVTVAMDSKGTVLEDHLTHMAHQVEEMPQEGPTTYIVFPVKDRNTTMLLKVININIHLNDIRCSVTD
jgi:hypothetical protein